MNNWKNDKRTLTKKTQAIVDRRGKSFFKEKTIQWLEKLPPKERIDLIERIFEKGQEASKSEKYVLIAGLYEILTDWYILPIDPPEQEKVRIPFDVLLTQIESVLEEKYAYFDELIKQAFSETEHGSLQEIIEVLKNWHKSEKTNKDFEAAKSALPPIAKTYDILCRTKGQCGAKTTDIIKWLGTAARDNSGYYRALFANLVNPEVIADLETWQEKSAEAGQKSKEQETRDRGDTYNINAEHVSLGGNAQHASRDINTSTPEPENGKGIWGQIKKFRLILGIIVSLIVIVGAYNKYIKKDKPVVEQTETPETETKQIPENKLNLSLRNICLDIDSSPLAHQNETAMRYIGVPLKEQELELFDIYSEDDKFGLNMIIPGQPDVTFLKGIRIYFSVDKSQYPELNVAKKGFKFYVTGKIEKADRFIIKLSDVSLDFE